MFCLAGVQTAGQASPVSWPFPSPTPRHAYCRTQVVEMDDLFQMSELSLHDLFSMGRGTYAGLVPAACQTNDDAKEEGAQTDEVRCRALSSCLAAPLGGLSFLRAAFHVVSADIDFLAGRLLLALHECGRNADSLCRRWPAHYDIHACTAAEPSSSAAVGQRAQQVEDDAEVYIMKALAPAPHDVARHPPVCTCVPAQVHVACSRPGQHQSHAHVYSCALMSLQNNAFHAPNSALSASWLGIQLRLGGRTSSTALLWYFACVSDGFCLCLRWYFACVFDGILPVSPMVFCLCLLWYFACVSNGFCLCLRWCARRSPAARMRAKRLRTAATWQTPRARRRTLLRPPPPPRCRRPLRQPRLRAARPQGGAQPRPSRSWTLRCRRSWGHSCSGRGRW